MNISENIQELILNRLKSDAAIQSEKAQKAIKQNTQKQILRIFADEQAIYENEVIPAVLEKIKNNPEDKLIKRSVMAIIKDEISQSFEAVAEDYASSFTIQATLDDFNEKVADNREVINDAKKVNRSMKATAS